MAEEEAKEGQTDRLDDVEAMARLQEEINNLPVSEHLVFMLQSLSSLAIDRLGFTPEAAARRDPEQARLAIDAFKALLTVLEQVRSATEISSHRSVLSQMQMAYVAALGAGGASAAAAPTPSEPAASAAEYEPSASGAAEQPTEASQDTEPAAPEQAPKKTTKPRANAKAAATGSAAKTGPKAAGAAGGKKGS
jgi:hypothetical protein